MREDMNLVLNTHLEIIGTKSYPTLRKEDAQYFVNHNNRIILCLYLSFNGDNVNPDFIRGSIPNQTVHEVSQVVKDKETGQPDIVWIRHQTKVKMNERSRV